MTTTSGEGQPLERTGLRDLTERDQVIVQADGAADKLAATAIARLALHGHIVHELGVGGYMVAYHCYSRHCPDVAALVAHARLVGVL